MRKVSAAGTINSAGDEEDDLEGLFRRALPRGGRVGH